MNLKQIVALIDQKGVMKPSIKRKLLSVGLIQVKTIQILLMTLFFRLEI